MVRDDDFDTGGACTKGITKNRGVGVSYFDFPTGHRLFSVLGAYLDHLVESGFGDTTEIEGVSAQDQDFLVRFSPVIVVIFRVFYPGGILDSNGFGMADVCTAQGESAGFVPGISTDALSGSAREDEKNQKSNAI